MEERDLELHAAILKQVEFYFSPANLLTDEHLSRAVRRSPNHWLPITYLLSCSRVRALLTQHQVPIRHRKKLLAKILSRSEVVRVDDFRVKRAKKAGSRQDQRRMIYLELQNHECMAGIKAALQQMLQEGELNKWSFKCKGNWAVVVPDTQQKSQDLEKFIRTKGSGLGVTRVLNHEEWAEQNKRYKQVVLEIKRRKQKQEKSKKPAQQQMKE